MEKEEYDIDFYYAFFKSEMGLDFQNMPQNRAQTIVNEMNKELDVKLENETERANHLKEELNKKKDDFEILKQEYYNICENI